MKDQKKCYSLICLCSPTENVMIPLVKESSSKSDEYDDGEEKEEEMKADSENNMDTTLPINDSRKTFLMR